MTQTKQTGVWTSAGQHLNSGAQGEVARDPGRQPASSCQGTEKEARKPELPKVFRSSSLLAPSHQTLRPVGLTCRLSRVSEAAGREAVPSQGQEENDLSALKDTILPRKKTPAGRTSALPLKHVLTFPPEPTGMLR